MFQPGGLCQLLTVTKTKTKTPGLKHPAPPSFIKAAVLLIIS